MSDESRSLDPLPKSKVTCRLCKSFTKACSPTACSTAGAVAVQPAQWGSGCRSSLPAPVLQLALPLQAEAHRGGDTRLRMSSSSRSGIAEIVDTSDSTHDKLRKLAATIYRDKLAADLKPLVDHDMLPVHYDLFPSLAEQDRPAESAARNHRVGAR